MIDTSSVESFINSIPKISEDIEDLLYLKMRLSGAISPAVASLAQRGFIGCLPFAHTKGDEYIVRLVPGKKITECPVGVAWWNYPEAVTLGINLSHFVCGRIVQRGLAGPDFSINDNIKEELIKLSNDLGDNGDCKKIIDIFDRVRDLDSLERDIEIWKVLSDNNPFYKALAGNLEVREDIETKQWLEKSLKESPEIDILWRMYATLIWNIADIDISEAVWKLALRDDVFDTTYNASAVGAKYGKWSFRGLIVGVNWMNDKNPSDIPIPIDLWEALKSYAAKPEKYDGLLHLEFAKNIAKENPTLAYIQTCNSALYFAKNKKKTPWDAIYLAYELAKENKWEYLETVLKWTVTELESANERVKKSSKK